MVDQQALLEVARGLAPADLVLANAQMVNVFTGLVEAADVALLGDTIAGIGAGYQALQTLDLRGRHLIPGMIDARASLEASQTSVAEYARIALAHGTTAVVVDLADIAAVSGLKGASELLESARGLPLDLFFSVPLLQIDPELLSPGQLLDRQALAVLEQVPRRVGYGGYLDCAGIVQGSRRSGSLPQSDALPMTGSAPGLLGKDLLAYVAAGVSGDDHWLSLAEAEEKLAAGLWLMAQESSTVSALSLLPTTVRRGDAQRCCLVTGRRGPSDLIAQGHLDHVIRVALRQGFAPAAAIRAATLAPATYYHMVQRGAIAPGYLADLVVIDNLTQFQIDLVLKAGKIVSHRGQPLARASRQRLTFGSGSIRAAPLRPQDLAVPGHAGFCRVIGVQSGDGFTEARWELAKSHDGQLVADPERDILKVAVIERHRASGRVGVGFVQGLGLNRGALCTSVAPPAHPLVVAGCSDSDMLLAVARVTDMQGGIALVVDGQVVESVPLPVSGLLAAGLLDETAERMDRLEAACWDNGSDLAHPATTLGALADLHVPALRLGDRGLINSDEGRLVGLQDES